jgi:DNA processing protein
VAAGARDGGAWVVTSEGAGLTVSPNTKAVLLLTAPLLGGRKSPTSPLLTPAEYRALARRLHELGAQPADLLASGSEPLVAECRQVVERSRLETLLGRGFRLSQAVERWQARAIWAVSRSDDAYPERLKTRLKSEAPALLYGCGDPYLLGRGGLAVVGSRKIDEALIDYTTNVGELAARAGRAIVSGGARGVDRAAMAGALEAGGAALGVLADGLERAAMNRENRAPLLEGRLVLISPYDPGARFNVGHAMQRNKIIYALADAALVVEAEPNRGGTWAGATEQLGTHRWLPVFVRASGPASKGLDALLSKGASAWPEPQDPGAFAEALSAREPSAFSARQEAFAFSASSEIAETRPDSEE